MIINENEVILTKQGLKDLEDELKHLLDVVRPQVINELVEARAQGDLSENADYDAARNRQAEVETKIKELETIISKAQVINDESSKTKDRVREVKLGSTVKILNIKNKDEMEIKIVGQIEAEPFEGKISNESPIAKSIMGRFLNEEVEIKGIKTPYTVRIIEIK
ncbi:transcription elongation factor GreA [Spiroplasma endosymbiont of Aspidapion aeneum]|uniref:transcription elongation factor GreA n=1 Tax=Spiroplasma endosymbiont of Aspidapion aeneum TaxID=3066276 RepID=UPI00313C773E